MLRYLQLEKKEDGFGYVFADSTLSSSVSSENIIPVENDFCFSDKRWNYTTKSWESYTPPEPPEPEPTMDEKIYEAVIKSQDEVRQEGADMVMDELLKRGLIV